MELVLVVALVAAVVAYKKVPSFKAKVDALVAKVWKKAD